MAPSSPTVPNPVRGTAFVVPFSPLLRRWLGVLALFLGVSLFSAERPLAMGFGALLGFGTFLVLLRSLPAHSPRALSPHERVLTAFIVVLISGLVVFVFAYLRSPIPLHPEARHAALTALRAVFVAACLLVLLRTPWRLSRIPPQGAA